MVGENGGKKRHHSFRHNCFADERKKAVGRRMAHCEKKTNKWSQLEGGKRGHEKSEMVL